MPEIGIETTLGRNPHCEFRMRPLAGEDMAKFKNAHVTLSSANSFLIPDSSAVTISEANIRKAVERLAMFLPEGVARDLVGSLVDGTPFTPVRFTLKGNTEKEGYEMIP